MRLIHSSLSLLYLLLAVLLPWLHMPMHSAAHQHEPGLVSSCDHNHTAPASESPESEKSQHHHHCALCQLAHVPAILPEVWVQIQNTGLVLSEPEPMLLPVEEVHVHPHQARAPPFQLI
jgi:ABC-type nickel/cobalt efflux system permease component RcnA